MNMIQQSTFSKPPITQTHSGSERCVGFEIEFSGMEYETARQQLLTFGCTLVSDTSAEAHFSHPLGDFVLELDSSYIKKLAKKEGNPTEPERWFDYLKSAAMLIVPLEVVCPPVPLSQLEELMPLTLLLREAGATGTEESPLAAYGMQINAEAPSLDYPTLKSYLLAFCLLQWWLVEAHQVDFTRKLSPFVDLFPEKYIELLAQYPDQLPMEQFITDYLNHNHTRNRALDMLPVFAEVNEPLVKSLIDEPLIKKRPAFHYRLPNCQIEKPEWSLITEWEKWLTVEKLANNADALRELAGNFIQARDKLFGVNKNAWVEQLDTWLKDHGLA